MLTYVTLRPLCSHGTKSSKQPFSVLYLILLVVFCVNTCVQKRDFLEWDMLNGRSGHCSEALTSCALCLFVFCLIPYLLDVATCDEFDTAPLHQPALVDGEKVDLSKTTTSPSSHDHQLSRHMPLPHPGGDREGGFTLASFEPTCDCSIPLLTSRPPPVS